MKIVLLHTHYQQKGGEDTVFDQELSLLDQAAQVKVLTFKNQSGYKGAIRFLLSIWNVFAGLEIKRHLQHYKPDVLHIHNWHFAIGPIAIWVAKRAGVPVVLTLHNYRLLCPSATLLHNGEVFTDSIEAAFPWTAIKNKVYRNSSLQTFWLAFIVWFHKKIGTWKMVDKYIVLTDFAKDIFVNSSFGIPENKFIVKHNFVPVPDVKPVSRENHFLFIGRLSEEKGIKILLDVFKQSNYTIHIAGEGPLLELVEKTCAEYANIKYIGKLDKAGVQREMKQCTALIFPSIWYEGMPMTIIEAFSLGLPVIASNLGAMSSMIKNGYNGLHFETGNMNALNQKLDQWAHFNEVQQATFGKNALATFEGSYTAEKNKEQFFQIYEDVMHGKKSPKRSPMPLKMIPAYK